MRLLLQPVISVITTFAISSLIFRLLIMPEQIVIPDQTASEEKSDSVLSLFVILTLSFKHLIMPEKMV